jgi:hypothetical protein
MKGVKLGVDEEHFATEAWLQKQVFVQRTLKDTRCSHCPISAHHPQPVVFLRSHGSGNFQEIVGVLRKEFASPPVARLAHLGFTSKIVELQNQLNIGCGWPFGHWLSSMGWNGDVN